VAEDNLAIAKASFDKAKTSLSLYMGIPIDENVKLQSSALKKKVHIHKYIEREVLESNYKMKMDSLSVDKNRLIHQSTRSAQFGSIDLVASHNRFSTLNNYNTDYVGVSYNVPLYTGGRMTAQEQQAKIGYQISQEQRASDEMALKEELRSLLIDIKRYGKTVKAKKAQLASAQSTLNVLKARYKEGLATYIEVLDSTTLVLNAKLGVLEAYYSRSLALDRIDYLKGKI
jgi:outer membrane protein TolC